MMYGITPNLAGQNRPGEHESSRPSAPAAQAHPLHAHVHISVAALKSGRPDPYRYRIYDVVSHGLKFASI